MQSLIDGMWMNLIQAMAYRRGARLLLMLALFVVLSLAFATMGIEQVLAGHGDPFPPEPPPEP